MTISFPSLPSTAAVPPTPEETRQRAKTAEAARAFEAAILSTLMQSMFEGVDAGAFGGGKGEAQFKSMLVDSFAKQVARSGGLGVADQVGREMLKMQGLSEEATHGA